MPPSLSVLCMHRTIRLVAGPISLQFGVIPINSPPYPTQNASLSVFVFFLHVSVQLIRMGASGCMGQMPTSFSFHCMLFDAVSVVDKLNCFLFFPFSSKLKRVCAAFFYITHCACFENGLRQPCRQFVGPWLCS